MANRTTKRGQGPPDPNVLAFDIVRMATGQIENPEDPQKVESAMSLRRLGGLKGGRARAAKLTAQERAEIARKAASDRWRK